MFNRGRRFDILVVVQRRFGLFDGGGAAQPDDAGFRRFVRRVFHDGRAAGRFEIVQRFGFDLFDVFAVRLRQIFVRAAGFVHDDLIAAVFFGDIKGFVGHF